MNTPIHMDLGPNNVSDSSFLGKSSISILLLIVLFCLAPMASQAQDTWGNRFIFNTNGSFGTVLDSPDDWADTRFTASENLTVDQFAVGVGAITGAPTPLVELYSDSGGNPGTLLATSVSGTLVQNSRYAGDFDTSASLTQGSVYHIVTRVTNASVSDRMNVNFGTGSDARYSPRSGNLDPDFARLNTTNSGTSWTVTSGTNQAFAGMYQAIVRNSVSGDGAGQGVGTLLLGSQSAAGSTATRGTEFIFDGGTGKKVESITLSLRKGTGDAAGDLRVLLLDDTNAVLSDDVLITGGTFSDTAFDFHTVNLSSSVSVTQGDTYRLVLYSPDSTASSYDAYFGKTLFLSTISGDGSTFQGTDGFKIAGTNLGSFTGDTTADMYFELGLIPEPTAAALLVMGAFGLLARRQRS